MNTATQQSIELTHEAQLEEENTVYQCIIKDLQHEGQAKDEHISFLNGVIHGLLLSSCR